MKFGAVTIDKAIGAILAHRLVDGDGKTLLNKGRILTADDIELLHQQGLEKVIVAQLSQTDIHENLAAERVGKALAGDNIKVVAPGVGRANLMATARGPLRVNVPMLTELNNIHEGITIASLRQHTLVNEGDLIALVKIIPFGIPSASVVDVERVASEVQPILDVRPLQTRSVALILSGPDSARRKLESFYQPVQQRIAFLGCTLQAPVYVSHTTDAVASAIRQTQADLILVAGISAIIDRDDIVPSALTQAGGHITHYGVPVDPGTLLMMGYIGDTPVVGAPGCIKSPKTNVIDWILPRLIAGERLTRADLVAMGHGGLLDDIRDRPMPRQIDGE